MHLCIRKTVNISSNYSNFICDDDCSHTSYITVKPVVLPNDAMRYKGLILTEFKTITEGILVNYSPCPAPSPIYSVDSKP